MKFKPEGYKESIEVDHVDTIKGMYIIEYMEGGAVVREGAFPEEVEE